MRVHSASIWLSGVLPLLTACDPCAQSRGASLEDCAQVADELCEGEIAGLDYATSESEAAERAASVGGSVVEVSAEAGGEKGCEVTSSVYCVISCQGSDTADNQAQDRDGDGSTESEDCDDGDAGSYPGATELCDGVDNNCDGTIDEGLTEVSLTDADEDGFGLAGTEAETCSGEVGRSTVGGDCDDGDPAIHPGAEELCDGVDNDCDTWVDLSEGGMYICVGAAVATLVGDEAGDLFGASIAVGADVSGDGHPDLLVGAVGHSSGAGQACLFEGYLYGEYDVADAVTTYLGAEGAGLGISLALEDGLLAVAQGAWSDPVAELNNLGLVAVDVAPLSDGTTSLEALPLPMDEEDRWWVGAGDDHVFGYAVAVGDLDRDGLLEVVASARNRDAIYVVPGGDDGFPASETPVTSFRLLSSAYPGDGTVRDYAGAALWVGDINGDGRAEVVIGAPHPDTVGRVFVVEGTMTGDVDLSSSAHTRLDGPGTESLFGVSVSVGNVSTDTEETPGLELLVGAGSDEEGQEAIYVFGTAESGERSSGEAFAVLHGTEAGERLGQEGGALTSCDLDGDGVDEIIVGAYRHQEERGAVYVAFGPLQGEIELGDEGDAVDVVRIVGADPGERLGWTVACAAILPGDDLPDLVVGAPRVSGRPGVVRVYEGTTLRAAAGR